MIRFRQEAAPATIGGFLLFSLFYFSYLYFFDFDEGVSAAPVAIKALKDVVYAAVAFALAGIALQVRIIPHPVGSSLVFAPLTVMLIVASLAHAPHTSFTEQVWNNIKNVVIFAPLYTLPFYFSHGTRKQVERVLCNVIVLSALAQCAFTVLYHAAGGRLWADEIYAGLIGNPNSFALLLNLSAAVILANLGRIERIWAAAGVGALGLIVFLILGTSSGSQSVVFIILFAFSFAFRPRDWKRFSVAAAVCLAVLLSQGERVRSTVFSIQGIVSALQGKPGSYVSLSVTNRVKDIDDALTILSGDAKTWLLGSFRTSTFRPMDGQFWTFLYNGGMTTLLAFAFGAAFVFLRSAVDSWTSGSPMGLAFTLMIVTFGVSFLASRVLMYFPFNVLFFLIAGLAVMRSLSTGKYKTLPHSLGSN